MTSRTKIRTYYPQSVFLPDGIERTVSLEQQKVIIGPRHLLDGKNKKEFDNKTLFYDMFFESNRLVCIGPPFYSIGDPLIIKHRGKRLRFKTVCGYGLAGPSLVYIEINQEKEPLRLEFIFKGFAINILYAQQNPTSWAKTNLSLVALQKDNPLVWIKDWCVWHSRAYSVDRIVLYDNGSHYWQDLGKELAKLDEEVEVILVNWPYAYGPKGRKMESYRLCRIGMLNHFRLFFGPRTSWCINIDIDEFLYFDSGLKLKEYLAQPEILAQPVVNLGSYLFPAGQQSGKNPARFYRHQLRYRPSYYSLWRAPKYICQPGLVRLMDVHRCYFKLWKLLTVAIFIQKIPFIYRLIKKPYKLLRIAVTKTKEYLMFLYKTKKQVTRRTENSVGLKDPSTALFFCHFRDLYTGWRTERNLTKNQKFEALSDINPTHLVLDRRVIDKAIEMRMIAENEAPPTVKGYAE